MDLSKGANIALAAGPITVTVRWSGLAAAVQDVDVSAFLLNSEGRVNGDEGMAFYGQPNSADGAVEFVTLSQDSTTVLRVEPQRLAPGLVKVAITATLSGSGMRPFSDVGSLALEVASGGQKVAIFGLDTADASEAALIMGEIYQRNGAWKFRAVGQGFNGGLQPLAENYGVTIATPSSSPPPPAPSCDAEPVNAPPSKFKLSKISLSKVSPTISLEKKGGTLGEITVNLNWNQGEPKKKGFFNLGRSSGIDLDLCCLYELADGTRFGIQALGRNFGNFTTPPYIELAGDDRTGAVAGGEWMRINGGFWSKIRRILIYAMIYDGVPNWSATDGVVTLFAPGNPDVEVLLEGASNERICAVALLENEQDNLKIKRENRYFAGAQEMDMHYRFNLAWTAGRK